MDKYQKIKSILGQLKSEIVEKNKKIELKKNDIKMEKIYSNSLKDQIESLTA